MGNVAGSVHATGNGRLCRSRLAAPEATSLATAGGLTLVGVLYRDAETTVGPLRDQKAFANLAVLHGGFPLNAGAEAAQSLPEGAVHIVSVVPWIEWPALRRSLPWGVELDAIIPKADPFQGLPISVVLSDRDRDLRQILKQRHDLVDNLWLDRITEGALRRAVIASGRVPGRVVQELQAECRRRGTRYCWCGGDTLPTELERCCDVVIVDRAEARTLARMRSTDPIKLALALAKRATVAGAIRVVTGGGTLPTAVVQEVGGQWECLEADPVTIDRSQVRYLKGAGDVFAARFLAVTYFEPDGSFRDEPNLAAGLQAARFAAAEFVARGEHLPPMDLQRIIERCPQYCVGPRQIRAWTVRKIQRHRGTSAGHRSRISAVA